MYYIRNSITAGEWEQLCPSLEVAGIRLVMIYERFVNRGYVPMWGAEWWCVPKNFKVECFHDAYRRAIAICTDTSRLITSVFEPEPTSPVSVKLLLVENSLPFQPVLSTNSILRIIDISGRLIEEKLLPAGTESVALPYTMSPGIYRILISELNGNITRSLFVNKIE